MLDWREWISDWMPDWIPDEGGGAFTDNGGLWWWGD